MGKARGFSDAANDTVYQSETNSENYAMGSQQNPYNLGSVHFSDQSGIGNFSQAGTDQRKTNIKGALFQGNIGFDLQTALLDTGTETIDLNNDSAGTVLSVISTDRFVTLDSGTTGTLTTITGPQRPGQRLRLYNTLTNTITITHTAAATVNTIRTPNATNLSFPGNGVLDLTWDITSAQWRVVGNVGGSGGVSFPIDFPEIDLGNVSGIVDIDWALSTRHAIKFTMTGNTTLTFSGTTTDTTEYSNLIAVQDGTGGWALTLPVGTVNASTVEAGILLDPDDETGIVIKFSFSTFYAFLETGNIVSGGANVPDGTAQFQHLEWDGAAWIAQQALAFGADPASSAQLNIPNDVIGIAWSNITNNGDIQLKTTTAGTLDLTRSDNTGMSFSIRSQDTVEADQSLNFTVGSGSITGADIVIDASTAILKWAVGGSQRMELDATVRTDLNLAAPSGGSLATFNVTSTDAVDPDNTITMTISSGTTGVGQIESTTAFLSLIAGGTTRFAIDATTGTEITQTAFGINPLYDLFHDDTPLDNDIIGRINFSADNSITTKTIFASIFVESNDVTDGTEDSTMYFPIMSSGFLTNKLFVEPDGIRITDGSIRFDEISLPSNPPTDDGLIYVRDDGGTTTPFFLDSSGTETSMITGASGANTALSNLASVAINTSLLPDDDGTLNLGSAAFSWLDTFTERLRIETGGASTSTANQIISDTGGMVFNVPAGDRYEFNISGSPNGITIEEDRIEFLTTGRQHRIDVTGTSINILSENITDSVEIWTGTGRTNATIDVNSTTTTFLTQTSDVQAVLIQLIQNNNTPADFRTIGNIDFMAENSASSNEIYARVSASSQDVTSATEDGLLQLGVISGGTLVSGIDIEGSSSGGANDALIGFFGESPVVQQNVASDTLANLYTALRNLGLIV